MPTTSGAGFGPPAISVAEASTTQVLEEIRRRQAAAISGPTTTEPSAEVPPESEETSGGEAAPPAKKAASVTQAETGTYLYQSARQPNHGAWVRGFVDWNRHSDLAPGQQENPTRNETIGGGMAGMDWTSRYAAREIVQVGVFGGGSADRTSFSNTQFVDVNSIDNDVFQRVDNRQDIDGGFVGGYLTYRKNNWLSDLAFKADILELTQNSTLLQVGTGGVVGNCATPIASVGAESGSSSLVSLTLAGNIANRMPHGENGWIAPTAGFRYTHTDYGSDTTITNFNPPNTTTQPNPQIGQLGLQDGNALRLQGGVRIGGIWVAPNRSIWETEIAALLYSDVWIDGFTYVSTSGGTVTPVDEGKVRGLGQIRTKVDVGGGFFYLFQGEVYGGEDLIGVAGQAGVRYEW